MISAVSFLLPVNFDGLTFGQILDFRTENELRRAKFQNTADALMESFGEASTEYEAKRILRLTEQELRDQYQKFETIYYHAKIEAAARTVGTIGGPPALLRFLDSVLDISCVEVAGFIASAALSVVPWLIAKEKANMAVNDSPWAYLWHLKRDLR